MPVSVMLVALQFAALAVLVVPWQARTWSVAGLLPIALAAALAGWTLWHNRPGNFSVLPEPLDRARLVTSGPYAHVRHPMYVAVVLFGLGCAIGWTTLAHGLALAALGIVLVAKARREERLLGARFPEYADYAARTPRFLPRRRPRRAR